MISVQRNVLVINHLKYPCFHGYRVWGKSLLFVVTILSLECTSRKKTLLPVITAKQLFAAAAGVGSNRNSQCNDVKQDMLI